MGLNPQQEKAVMCNDKKIVCMAGAGSGKTFCLIERISRLVEDGVRPDEILALTFTRAAALEMRERYIAKHPGSMPPDFRTFHSYCYHLMSTDINVRQKLGYTNIPAVAESSDAKKVVSKAKLQVNCKLPQKKLDDPSLMTPKEVYEYKTYQKALMRSMKAENIITFDMLCKGVCDLFKDNDPSIVPYKQKLKHVIVDEFQDTDMIQFNFVNSFTDSGSSVFTVGDVLQGIYSFRGADSSIMKKLIDDPDWTVIKLYKNYRSCKEVCSYANRNTRYASEKYRIELNPEKSDDGEVHIDHFEQHDYELFPEDTLEDIVVDITDRQKCGNVALLARSNKEVSELKAYLKAKNIEFVSHNRNEDAIRFLRASGDNEYFMDWVTTQLNSEQYARYVRLHTIENPENDVKDFYTKFSNILRIKYIMDTVSMIRVKFRDPTLTNVLKANEILKLIGIDERDHDFKINDYSMTELYDYLVDAVQENTKSDIYVGTIHSVKGLEYDSVILAGVDGKTFPLMNEDNNNLFYVGITRAKDWLKVYEAI